MVCVALVGAWIICGPPTAGDDNADRSTELPPSFRVKAAHDYAQLASGLEAYAHRLAAMKKVAARAYDPIFDSHLLGLPTASFVSTASLQEDDVTATPSPVSAPSQLAAQKTASAATAPARNNHLAPAIRTGSVARDAARANQAVASVAPDAPAEKPTLFERLFGKSKSVSLAYAAPDDGGLMSGAVQSAIAARYDRTTAVYDISAHKVYMPDGTVLEAHSGRGSTIDDPNHTNQRMQGSTPVNIYDLQMRESLFHGVQAIRLIPVNEDKVFGRSGFLAHTYMLGPNGDSFGCVSFRDYNAFLQAYKNHEIKRLAVVASLN